MRMARRQEGYALLVILLVLSVFVLGLSRIALNMKTAIQREREARMIDHAREYREAIKRYFHKNGRYPASLDVLLQKDGNGIRYLRQQWPDPLNSSPTASGANGQGDGSWQILHYGQAVTAEIVDQPPQAASGSGSSGSAIAGPALAGPSTPGAGPMGQPSFANSTSGIGFATAGQTPGGVAGGSGGAMAGAPGSPAAAAGGGPVIGVASLNKEPAVHAFNGFDTPDHWQFVYNFALDPSLRAGGAMGVPGQTGAPGAGLTPGTPTTPPGPGH